MSLEIADRRSRTVGDCDVLVVGGGAAGVATDRFLRAYGTDTVMPEAVSELIRTNHGKGNRE